MSKSQVIFGQMRRDKGQKRGKHFAILAVFSKKDFAIVAVFERKNFAILAVFGEKHFAIM